MTQVIKVGYGPCGVGINIGDFNIGLDKKCTIYDTRTRFLNLIIIIKLYDLKFKYIFV